jgi:hypothetical protein
MQTAIIKIPKDTVSKIKDSHEALQGQVEGLKITDGNSYDAAANLFATVSAYRKRVDQLKEEHTRPTANALKEARDTFKMLSEPFEKMEGLLRGAMNVYVNEQDRIAREEAAKQIEAAKKAEAEAKKAGKEPEPQEMMPEPIEAPDLNRRTAAGHVHTRTKQTLVITDFKKLADKWKLPNEKEIKAALLDGRRVPGAELKEEKVVASR